MSRAGNPTEHQLCDTSSLDFRGSAMLGEHKTCHVCCETENELLIQEKEREREGERCFHGGTKDLCTRKAQWVHRHTHTHVLGSTEATDFSQHHLLLKHCKIHLTQYLARQTRKTTCKFIWFYEAGSVRNTVSTLRCHLFTSLTAAIQTERETARVTLLQRCFIERTRKTKRTNTHANICTHHCQGALTGFYKEFAYYNISLPL